jgi:hypothetical protein
MNTYREKWSTTIATVALLDRVFQFISTLAPIPFGALRPSARHVPIVQEPMQGAAAFDAIPPSRHDHDRHRVNELSALIPMGACS